MDFKIIIFIIAAFCLGCVLAWFFVRSKTKPISSSEVSRESNDALADLEKKISVLKEENEQLQSKTQEKEKLFADQVKETEKAVKAQYDQLLQRITDENTRLDSALKLATEGKIDESIKSQLLNAEKSAERIIELEKELEELHKKQQSLMQENEPIRQELSQAKTECSKLIKKIKNLEEDLEEAEEEQDSLEKKLKQKNDELYNIEDELNKANKEKKQLKEDLEKRENELKSRMDELKRKSDSIKFVQDILKAADGTGAETVKELYRAIDGFESFLQGQYMDCNYYLFEKFPSLKFNGKNKKEGHELKKKWYTQAFEEWASVKRKSWLDKKTTIAFVGEFSAGKTSIVNRILSQDDPNIPRLPVSAKATTAIPTYIAGGPGSYSYVTPDNKLKTIDVEIFKKVSKEVLDEIGGVSSLIKYFVMLYENKNLTGLSILDTPGFNSNDKEDAVRTIEVINECDALFWVIDVNNGNVNKTSLTLIKKNLNKPLIVVINKVDTKSKSEVDKMEALTRQTFIDAGLSVEKIIRFSSKAQIEDIMDPIKSIHHDEKRDNFLDTVEQNIKQLSATILSQVKKAEKQYNECQRKSDLITEIFVDQLNELRFSCDTARDIPQFKAGTKFLGMDITDDRYQMSCYEAENLMNLLDNISDTLVQNLVETYDDHTESVAEDQQAYNNLVDIKSSWQKIDDCLKEFNKIKKQFDQLNQKNGR